MSNTNKVILLIVVAILAIALIVWQNNKPEMTDNNQPSNETEQGTQNSSSEENGTSSGSTATNKTNFSQSYNDALKAYGTNRIQFDEFCTATPNNVTFKSGSKIMLDNRSNDQRKITVDGVIHNIAAFSYKIITLPTVTTTNKTVLVNCADLVNVARILIQK